MSRPGSFREAWLSRGSRLAREQTGQADHNESQSWSLPTWAQIWALWPGTNGLTSLYLSFPPKTDDEGNSSS